MIQNQALNYILDSGDKNFLAENNIGIDFFSDYKGEFSFIQEHINNYGNVPDKMTFLSAFPDFDVVKVNEGPAYIIKELYKERNKRTLAKIFNGIRDLLNEDNVEDAVKLYTSAIDQVTQNTRMPTIDIMHDLSRYDSYEERTKDISRYFVKTGFPELDAIIGGWNRKEELAVIMARPGTAKSWTLLKSAAAAAQQGLRVGFYSGEMTAELCGYRLDTLIGHVSNGSLVFGNKQVQMEYKKYIANAPTQLKGTIKILTPQMIGGMAGVSSLRAFIEKDKLDILFVDQHSLLDDDRKGRTPVEKASNISKDLKALQVLSGIPIITASQQNRSDKDENDKASVANIAQSDRIGQDATNVIALDRKDGVLSLFIAKSRNAVSGRELKYAVDLDKGNFVYIPTDKEAADADKCKQLQETFDYDNNDEETPFEC